MSRLYDLQKFCRDQRGWLIETTEALARLESPTTDKVAVDRCGRDLAARMEAIGGCVTRLARVDRGDHLRAEFAPVSPDSTERADAGRARGQILLLGHFDTVWPVGQLAQMPIAQRDGRLHGPGVFDMKAGIAIALLATRALLSTGHGPMWRIVMLWTTDEETGSATSREAIEDEARRSEAVFVLEPSLPGGALKTSRKGCGGYELVVHGVAAHAGIEPDKGASAVQELAHQILRINALQDLARGILVNVVQVTGGRRSNVIPDEARAIVDVRVPTMADAVHVDAAIRALRSVDPRTCLAMTGGIDRPPLERSGHVARLYRQAQEIARALGHVLGEGGTGGGSDGNFTAALGVPTLDGLGAIGDGAHALHEHVEIGPLPDRAALVAELIAAVSGGPDSGVK
jgi:glutamate carboxypeptidase